MPTIEMMGGLVTASQEMLEEPGQTELTQNRVRNLTRAIPDEITRIRVERMPATAAVGMLSSEIAIGLHRTDENELMRDENVSAIDDYFRMTAEADERASVLTLAKLKDPQNPFHSLYSIYSHGVEEYRDYTIAHPEEARKKGKLPETADDPGSEGQLLMLLSGNAQYTTYPHILREVIRVALEESELPSADEIANRLKNRIRILQSAAASSIQFFTQLSAGEEYARERSKQIKTGSVSLPRWGAVMQEYLDTGTVPPAAAELAAASFKQPLHSQRRLGHCAGQAAFTLRPSASFVTASELSGVLADSSISPTEYFAERGITLEGNAFSSSLYQLTQGVEAGKVTIFNDPQYRAAIEGIVAYARSRGVSAEHVSH